jgi:hypothetical protein
VDIITTVLWRVAELCRRATGTSPTGRLPTLPLWVRGVRNPCRLKHTASLAEASRQPQGGGECGSLSADLCSGDCNEQGLV